MRCRGWRGLARRLVGIGIVSSRDAEARPTDDEKGRFNGSIASSRLNSLTQRSTDLHQGLARRLSTNAWSLS